MVHWSAFPVALLLGAFFRKLLREWRMCPSKARMDGKTVIITGANSGIGKATAKELARRQARVILACRTLKSAQVTATEIKNQTKNGEIVARELNLASMTSIREFCACILQEEQRVDVLINNAGVFNCPYSKTEDGFELQMGVNHFGHFLLTVLLLDRIKSSSPSRIVNVSSNLYAYGAIPFHDIHGEHAYSRLKAYCNSKLANCLFTTELSLRLQGTGVKVYALHPGSVTTNAARHFLPKWFTDILYPIAVMLGVRDADEGCQTSVYCSVSEDLSEQTGGYYVNCKRLPWSSAVMDDKAAEKLWALSEELTGLK